MNILPERPIKKHHEDGKDDVQGHAFKMGRAVEQPEDGDQKDIEGFARGRMVDIPEGEDDVEGNALRIGKLPGVTDDDGDDVEGHARRYGAVEEPEDGEDDVEGHTVRRHVVEQPEGEDDVEGNLACRR